MAASTTELFPEYASLAVKFLLLPAAGIGGLLIAIAKLNRIEGSDVRSLRRERTSPSASSLINRPSIPAT